MLPIAWQPKFEWFISLAAGDRSDHKVARVGRPATDYMLVVRLWESST